MIIFKKVNKIYHSKEGDFHALKNINITIHDHDFVAIVGESGSGKSTLLNMISGIDTISSGELIINGEHVEHFTDEEFRNYRFNHIGFVFQRYNLVDHLTASENVALPLIFSGMKKEEYLVKASNLLSEMGIANYTNTASSNLSGGQKQRLAIARSILMDPEILLCDEPTGSLDYESGQNVMELLVKYKKGRTVILVTHDEELAYKYANRIIRISDGEVISDEIIREPSIEEIMEKEFKSLVMPTSNNAVRLISKRNFKLNRSINMKIIVSMIIAIALMLFINLYIGNMMTYNTLMFERNNDFKKYTITNMEPNSLSLLKQDSKISEVGIEYTYPVEFSYYTRQYGDIKRIYLDNNQTPSPNSVHDVKLTTLPEQSENFYLNSFFLAKSNKKALNGIYVTQELIYSHYLGMSLYTDLNKGFENNLSFFEKSFSIESFLNQHLYICSGVLYNESCFDTVIIGILDSNEMGINYAGTIFISQEGFHLFQDYLKKDLNLNQVDSYFEQKSYFFYKDFNKGKNNTKQLEDKYHISIQNQNLSLYRDTLKLERIGNFIIIILVGSLFLIYGIVGINMTKDQIENRKVDVGVYTSLGIPKKIIPKIFLFESISMIKRFLIYNIFVYLLLLGAFWVLNPYLITNNIKLLRQYGRVFTLSSEWLTFLIILLLTCLLHLLETYYYGTRLSKKKATEILSW